MCLMMMIIIMSIKRCFFQINCVIMRGINDDEICDFVDLTLKKVTKYASICLKIETCEFYMNDVYYCNLRLTNMITIYTSVYSLLLISTL